MAGSKFVQFSKDEFESWLGDISRKWKKKSGTAGVYRIMMSDNVAVEISSSMKSDDEVMNYARASAQMRLVSTLSGRVLNKKAQGQSHFKRTKNWRDTWAKGVERMKQAYMKSATFYDRIASIEDPKKYKKEWLEEIETRSDWKDNEILSDFYEKLEKGNVLSVKQEAFLKRLVAEGSRRDEDYERVDKREEENEEREALLNKLRKLYAITRRYEDEWTMNFTESIGKQLKKNRDLSRKQVEIMEEKFRKYRIAKEKLAAMKLAFDKKKSKDA